MMEDRFKFRIWIKSKNKMYKVHSLHLNTNKAMISSLDGIVSIELDKNKGLMQCTGLKDKNGKLIYEGDIVRLFNTKYNFEEIRQVVYKDCAFQFSEPNSTQIDRPLYCFAINYLNRYKHIELEVIGSIYENPEVLKESE